MSSRRAVGGAFGARAHRCAVLECEIVFERLHFLDEQRHLVGHRRVKRDRACVSHFREKAAVHRDVIEITPAHVLGHTHAFADGQRKQSARVHMM